MADYFMKDFLESPRKYVCIGYMSFSVYCLGFLLIATGIPVSMYFLSNSQDNSSAMLSIALWCFVSVVCCFCTLSSAFLILWVVAYPRAIGTRTEYEKI